MSASNERVRAAGPRGSFEFEGRGYEVSWRGDHAIVWCDPEAAGRMAEALGTEAKGGPLRHDRSKSFHIVRLP